MSRGYRIQMRAPVTTRHGAVQASDGLRMDVDLLPILDVAQMKALLADVLAQAGWHKKGDTLETEIDGARVRLKGDHLSITVEAGHKVRGQGTSAKAAETQMRVRRDAAKASLDEALRRKVAKVEAALCEALEPAVQAVYVEALKRKAAMMGEITSIDERRDGDQVELTIKVKV